jgi:hypothetical protein
LRHSHSSDAVQANLIVDVVPDALATSELTFRED